MTDTAAASGSSQAPGGFALDGVAVRGVVSAVPRRKVGNDAFVDRFGEAAVADVIKMIGVENRYWVEDGGTASDLCQAAAQTLLQRLDWPADSLDALIFVSQTPDHRLPATACVLHGKLGLAPHAQAFDVNLGCSGYVYGLWLAGVLVKAGLKRVLLLAGDTISRTIDPADRGTALVFGDAGSATAVEAAPGAPAMHFRLGTDGKGAGHLIIPDGAYRAAQPDPRREAGPDPASLFMDGGEVFAFTLRAVPKLVKDTLADAGTPGDSVEAYLLHQANRFMLKHLGKKIGADGDRLPINIDRFGNTSSATLPLLLTTDMADRVTHAPTKVMLVGFGVGFSWGAALIDLAPLACAETLYL